MLKKLVIASFFTLFALRGMAQGKLPDWYYRLPQPSSNAFRYVVATGSGSNEEEAKNMAYADVLRQAAMINRIRYDSEEIFQALQKGKDYQTISTTYDIAIAKVCEQFDNSSTLVKVYFLFQVATSHSVSSKDFDVFVCPENKIAKTDALYVDDFTVYQNGEMLSDAKLRTMFANSKSYRCYDAALRCKDASNNSVEALLGFGITGGTLMVLVGLPVMVASHYTIDGINSEREKRQFYTGVGILGAGGVLFLTGMCWQPLMRMIGRAKIRKAVNLYNNGKMYSQNGVELEYGLKGNGIHLTFSF